MERKKASDFPQDLLNLFDRYVHGEIHRREFIDGAQKFAVGGVTATALFEMLRPNYAWAIQVPESDTRIKVEPATIPSPKGNGAITGYMARPADATGKLPAVLVIHENRGLNPYIKDVARRLAVAKFMALAPDGLTSVGGYPGDDENGGKLFTQVDRAKMSEDFLAAAAWLKSRPDSTGKLGAIGFCFGGGTVNLLAVRMGADLDAAVPFYGGQPSAADVAKIKAPLLAQYGELDTRITSGWPAFDTELTAAHVPHEGYVYSGANHGFHNDTTPRWRGQTCLAAHAGLAQQILATGKIKACTVRAAVRELVFETNSRACRRGRSRSLADIVVNCDVRFTRKRASAGCTRMSALCQ
jgi:carboxymethylenebutenolidase